MIGVLNSWLATSMNAVLSWPARASSPLASISRALASCSSAISRRRSASRSYCSIPWRMIPSSSRGVPRLEDVAEDVPFVDRVDDGLDVGVAGEEHPDRVGLELAGLAEEDVARHARHALIGEDHVDVVVLEQLDRRLARGTRQDAIGAVEQVAQALQDVHFVVDDQQGLPPSLRPVGSSRLKQGRISHRIDATPAGSRAACLRPRGIPHLSSRTRRPRRACHTPGLSCH